MYENHSSFPTDMKEIPTYEMKHREVDFIEELAKFVIPEILGTGVSAFGLYRAINTGKNEVLGIGLAILCGGFLYSIGRGLYLHHNESKEFNRGGESERRKIIKISQETQPPQEQTPYGRLVKNHPYIGF